MFDSGLAGLDSFAALALEALASDSKQLDLTKRSNQGLEANSNIDLETC